MAALPLDDAAPEPVALSAAHPSNWKALIWRNTLTSFMRLAVRMLSGLVTFRLLYNYLPSDEFGCWALLWSLFGYTLLLDFGMGATTQREVARHSANQSWDKLSALLSTTVWSFFMLGLIVFTIFMLGQNFFIDSVMHVSPVYRDEVQRASVGFVAVICLGLSCQVFNEILKGLQRLDLVNWLNVSGFALNLPLIFLGVRNHWSFVALTLVGLATNILPGLGAVVLVRRMLPQVSFSPRLFQIASIRSVLGFSLVVYIILFRNVIMLRTDQFVISVCLGVAAVALYQAGFKIVEVFTTITSQLLTTLPPVAANLHAVKDFSNVRRLLLSSTRLLVLSCGPLYMLSAVYFDVLVRLITGLRDLDPSIHMTGEILLASFLSGLITNSCTVRILVMCGWERELFRLTLVEGVLKLVLAVILTVRLGIVGTAIGNAVPMLLVGWLGMVPVTLRFTQCSFGTWLREVILPVLAPLLLSGLLLLAAVSLWPVTPETRLWHVVPVGVVVILPVLLYAWRGRKTGF